MRDTTAGWTGSRVSPVSLPRVLLGVYDDFRRERFPKAEKARVAADVARMSEAFTAEREELPGSYLNHPPSRSAYLAFFHPLQVLRATAALEETLARAAARGLWGGAAAGGEGDAGGGDAGAGAASAASPALRVLDLGAGLGAMTHALLVAGGRVGGLPSRVEATLVDHQRSALVDARDLLLRAAGALRPGAPAPVVRTADQRLAEWLGRAERAGWTYDVVLVGAVLNEVADAPGLMARAARRLDPSARGGGLVVVVEPAIPAAGRDVMAAREALLGVTTTIAPCTHGRACPLLALSRDWCFTTRPARFPPFVEEMSRRLRHQTEEVRYAFWAAAGRADAAPFDEDPRRHARVVSDKVEGGQVLCLDGRRERLPERAPEFRRGERVVRSAIRSDVRRAPPGA